MATMFAGDKPQLNGLSEAATESATEVDRMRVLIDTISAYIEYFHGGAVKMVSYDQGVLKIAMTGACQGCELSAETLHGWVEGTVRQFFSELKAVEAVQIS